METVHIRCRKCQELIAVATEDLGFEIQCPLCQAQFQAERTEPADTINSPLNLSLFKQTDNLDQTQEEATEPSEEQNTKSIFDPEAPSEDEIFRDNEISNPDEAAGVSTGDNGLSPSRKHTSELTTTDPKEPSLSKDAPEEEATPAWPSSPDAQKVSLDSSDEGIAIQESLDVEEPEELFGTDSSSILEGPLTPTTGSGIVRSPQARTMSSQSGLLTPMLLIVLVPYSITVTIVLVYMLLNWPYQDPLERMLEEQNGESPVQRVKHDSSLSARLRVSLNDSLEIGSVKIVPKKVILSNSTLALHVELHNISDNLRFNPFPQKFATHKRKQVRIEKRGNRRVKVTTPAVYPYVFLEGQGFRRIYGGKVDWFTDENGELLAKQKANLDPGQSLHAVLQTDLGPDIISAKVLNSPLPLLWRIHLRRGLEYIADQDRSITCVVGIEFLSDQIIRSG